MCASFENKATTTTTETSTTANITTTSVNTTDNANTNGERGDNSDANGNTTANALTIRTGEEGGEGLLNGIPIPAITCPEEILRNYGANFKVVKAHPQLAELLTIIRDKNTTRSDFKFYADRLIRLVIEESLNQLPYSDCSVETPTGAIYDGLKYQSGNCGVSIIRSGEAMEQGLRDCCRSIRIGKILVESDSDTHEAHVVYARFPDDIARRQILLMYPIMSTGNTVLQAVNVLKEHGVPESSIILSNLFCTPMAATCVVSAFPRLKILTSELHPVAPNHFGQKYFGTD